MAIGERIRLVRQRKEITLEELGNYIGVSRQTTQKYESGVISNIPSDKIEGIAKFLNVSPAYLMGWETNDKQPQHSLRLTDDEQQLITKYRCLDVRGKYAIDTTLQREYEFYLSEERNSVSGA